MRSTSLSVELGLKPGLTIADTLPDIMNFNPGDEVCVITYCAARQGQVGVVRSVLPKMANEPDRFRTYVVEFVIATGARASEHYLGMELEKLNESHAG